MEKSLQEIMREYSIPAMADNGIPDERFEVLAGHCKRIMRDWNNTKEDVNATAVMKAICAEYANNREEALVIHHIIGQLIIVNEIKFLAG